MHLLLLLHRLIVIALGYKLQQQEANCTSSSSGNAFSPAHPILTSRVDKTRDVLRCNRGERVVVFSGNGSANGGSTEARIMEDIFEASYDSASTNSNVCGLCIKLEEESTNTVENSLFIRRMLLADGILTTNQTLHIVSSRFHQTRVRLIFDHVFSETLEYHSADDIVDNLAVAELLIKEAASILNLNNYLHANFDRFQLKNISENTISLAHRNITFMIDNILHL